MDANINQRFLDQPIFDQGISNTHFFNGRVLTAGDLQDEQRANRRQHWQLGRGLGRGIVRGLDIRLVDAGGNAQAPVVSVSPGLAFNGKGQAVELSVPLQALVLEAFTAPVPLDAGLFHDCPLAVASVPRGSGIVLLTAAPASTPDGQAPLRGFNDGTVAGCGSRYDLEGLRFRTVTLSPEAIAKWVGAETLNALKAYLGKDDIPGISKLRNRLAHLFLGSEELALFWKNPLAADPAMKFGLLERLLADPAGPLDECEVPLALLYATAQGVRFLDQWAVRRRLVFDPLAASLGQVAAPRGLAEAEAAFFQFQDQLADLAQAVKPATVASLKAADYFDFLPPAGYLPVSGGGTAWKGFLGLHAPAVETSLHEGLAPALIRQALFHAPVRLVAGGAQPLPSARFKVYRVAAQPGYVLFARSNLAETVAADVPFDNTLCQLSPGKTVQDAIEALSARDSGCCTLHIRPGPNWHLPLLAIAAGQNAEICFDAGDYPLTAPLSLSGKGHLRIVGTGPGTRLRALASEAALSFSGCQSVSVSRIAAESSVTGSVGQGLNQLNGVLTFLDCPDVEVDRVVLRCGGGGPPAAACLTVRNPDGKGAGSAVRVSRSTFNVGHQQTGMVFVNVGRASITDNVLQAAGTVDRNKGLADGEYRGRLRRGLITAIEPLPAQGAGPGFNGQLTYHNVAIRFRSDPAVVSQWLFALNQFNPASIANVPDLKRFLERLASRLIQAGGSLPGLVSPSFNTVVKAILAQDQLAAGQGIVVAGRLATEVRILDNSLDGFIQGIHVGISHFEPQRGNPDVAGSVWVERNTVRVFLPTSASRERHGIFVGNCGSLTIRDNYLDLRRVARASGLRIEGIRVFGFVDRRVIVRGNHLLGGFNVGIRFEPRTAFVVGANTKLQWIITDNMATQAQNLAVQVPANLRSRVRGVDDNYS